MKKHRLSLIYCIGICIFLSSSIQARDVARDLRKMVGYTIVFADTVDEVIEKNYGDKYIKLNNGKVFKIEFLLLDPLPLTDVIVFAKPFPKDLLDKYKDKLPEHLLYSYKILIDNEVHDITPE